VSLIQAFKIEPFLANHSLTYFLVDEMRAMVRYEVVLLRYGFAQLDYAELRPRCFVNMRGSPRTCSEPSFRMSTNVIGHRFQL
jgi:hypothetical protein